VRILVSNLGLSVRQRPLVYVGVCGDRHSVSHSAQPSGSNAGLSVNGVQRDTMCWRPRAYARGMVSGRRGRAVVAGLVAVLALAFSVIGCTGSAGTRATTERGVASGRPAASVCTRAGIKAAIAHFFDAWNHRQAAALGRLFTVDGVLDMTTKHQGLQWHEWASVGGPGGRRLIADFAKRQWRLGEKLSNRGISAELGGEEGGDGLADVMASFADGTVQPMAEAKFIYDCAGQGFAHVVIVAEKAAGPA
jgi:hypothetical protein